MKYKVLIIDDDRSAMQYYEWALQRHGMDTRRAYEADGALEMVRTEKPDLIILDIMMPPGESYGLPNTQFGLTTGLLLCKDLREKFSDVPRLVLTAVQNPDTIGTLHGQGELVLRKNEWPPFDLAEKVIQIILNRSQRMSSAPDNKSK